MKITPRTKKSIIKLASAFSIFNLTVFIGGCEQTETKQNSEYYYGKLNVTQGDVSSYATISTSKGLIEFSVPQQEVLKLQRESENDKSCVRLTYDMNYINQLRVDNTKYRVVKSTDYSAQYTKSRCGQNND